MTTVVFGVIIAKSSQLFTSSSHAQKEMVELSDTQLMKSSSHLQKTESAGTEEDMTNAYVNVKSKYPYICGNALKRDLTKWQQSDYVSFVANEHWNGQTNQTYYEQTQSDYASSSWSHSASQTLSLPKGKYLMTIAARAADQVVAAMSVTIDGSTLSVDLPNKGSVGKGIDTNGYATVSEDSVYANDNQGFGWEYRYIEFETTQEDQSVTISLLSSTAEVNQWISLCNPILYTNTNSSIVEPYDEIGSAIVTHSDVDLHFTNDETYPWIVEGNAIKNGNCGVRNSSSVVTLNYVSESMTELSFDWLCYNSSSHSALRLFVDGVQMRSTTNSSYNSVRLYVAPGEHVIVIKDSIGNSTSSYNNSYLTNLIVKEIKPLETAVLTEKSKPLTFVNDGEWPWTIEDGYIQNSNYGHSYCASSFSTSFTIDKPSKFSYDKWVNRYDEYTSNASSHHHFQFYINGVNYMTQYYTNGWYNESVFLEPGDYTLVFRDTIFNTTTAYYSRIRNMELSSDWVDVEVSTPGSLGVEILYKVNVLNDVELLKVKGTLNETDWTTIKNCKNLVGIDLTEAKFENLPDYAFDGMSRVSSVKLPEGVKTIGSYAFRGTQLLNIDIPSSVTYIGSYAFYQTRVRTVNFKEDSQLLTIGAYAFYQCTSLKEFIMPDGVATLGKKSGSSYYSDWLYDGKYYSFYYSNIFDGCTSLTKIHFSDALKVIPNSTCDECTKLSEVTLPKNVESIEPYAFYKTSNLRNITIPESTRNIYIHAFQESGIDSISLPLKLSHLSEYAFRNCDNLKYIELPSYIGNYENQFYDCNGIEKVVSHSATPPTISTDPFSNGNSKKDITLVVPSFAVVNYKLDTYWMQFGSIVEGDDIDYWKITSELSLTNNRRMDGKPDIDLYYGGKLRVGGNAPMESGVMNYYISESNPGQLINDCQAMASDSITSIFSVDANTWYFFTPVHDVDLTKVTHSANASYVFRYYDGESRGTNGTGNSWKNVDTGKLLAGQGYIFQCNASGTLSMPADATGHLQILNTEDVTKALNAYESTTSANKSWNYVGNPYPSYYDIYYMDFTAPVTVWTGSTYKAYSIVDDNYVLRPMQSFFVQKPDEIDNIIFHKEGRQFTSSISRASYAPQRAKSTEDANRYLFDIQISNEEDMIDETRVVINDKALCTYEMDKDASKFMSMENGVPQLFTLDKEGNNYAINERPAEDGNVALGYRAAQSGFYTISIVKAAGEVLLYDKKIGKTIDLTTQDYTFYSDATESVDNTRFTLIFGNMTPTGISSTSNASASVVASSGCITINGAEGQNVMVFTADGRSVFSGTLKNDALRVDVANGAYIVKVGNSAVKTVVSSK